LEFFVNECGMSVNTVTTDTQRTALHFAIFCDDGKEKNALTVVQVLVERLGIDTTLKDFEGMTAADVALMLGHNLIYDYLTRDEREAKAKALLAEREAVAKAAEEEFLAELEAEEAKKAQKKEKSAKKKKSGGGGSRQNRRQSASGGGGGGGIGVAAVTEAVSSLNVADRKEGEEEKKEEKKMHKVEDEPPAPEAALNTPAPAKQDDDSDDEKEADEDFLLVGAPDGFICPISFSLMKDPVRVYMFMCVCIYMCV
jgi:hypothetical protein